MNNSRFSNLTNHARHCVCASWIVPLLLLLALPGAVPGAVQAQFTYTINNGTVTITGYTGPGGAVTIPSTIAGLPVTATSGSLVCRHAFGGWCRCGEANKQIREGVSYAYKESVE